MVRPSKHETFLRVAETIAQRSTCRRNKVGCVLIDSYGHIIGTGFNGVGRGLEHCIDNPCGGVDYPRGEGLDVCEAIHAEQNALLQCADVQSIGTAYVTHSPCMHCAKLFLNTGTKKLIFSELYMIEALDLLKGKIGISTYKLRPTKFIIRENLR